MPYTYAIEGRLVHVSWQGVVSKEDLQSLGETLPRLARELDCPPDILHTFDGVGGYTFQPIAAYMLALMRKRVEIPVPVRSAVVATTPETHAVGKIFKALNRTHNLEMELFASEAEARRWLRRE